MDPRDTVHMKTGLFDSLEVPYMHRFFDFWVNRDAGAKYTFPTRKVGSYSVPWTGEMICSQFQRQLQVGESWYASAEVLQIVEAMRVKMPPEVLEQTDPPSTHGFLLLEDPWMQTDVHGRRMAVRAICWATESVGKGEYTPVKNGLTVWCMGWVKDHALDDYWSDDQFPNMENVVKQGVSMIPTSVFTHAFGGYALSLADTGGVWVVSDSEDITLTESDEDGVWLMSAAGGDQVMTEPLGASPAVVDTFTGPVTLPGWNVERRVTTEPVVGLLQCLWRFQQQQLTAIDYQDVPRGSRKHLMRRQMSQFPIGVIKWRKRAPGAEGDRTYELSHRFVVRGHWRRQWYPSEQRHKSIYIRPHLKGPEGAPILTHEKVNAVIR